MNDIVHGFRAAMVAAMLGAGSWAQAADGPPPDITGRWAGSFDIKRPDGGIQKDTAVLILEQHGGVVTGSVGSADDKLSPITAGKAAGSEFQLEVEAGGAPMSFRLRLEGDHLKGEATSPRLKANIDAVRAAASPPALYAEIARMDGVLFDAYNRRDLAALKTLFTPDLEFYHDKGGLTSYAENMESFARGFQGPETVRRQLVHGTLEVYPIAGFGAVEIGIYRFYFTAPGQAERLTATAKFMHLWKNVDGAWKIARVVSYDHR